MARKSDDVRPTAEQSAIARAGIGVSDEAMTGAWRVIIARTPDRYVAYYYHENDDIRIKAALKRQAERWIANQRIAAESALANLETIHGLAVPLSRISATPASMG